MEDGYNYVSIGERDEMTEDNIHFKEEFTAAVTSKLENILNNSKKQQEIIKNQLEIYNQYFITPQQFVKKIFMEKIK